VQTFLHHQRWETDISRVLENPRKVLSLWAHYMVCWDTIQSKSLSLLVWVQQCYINHSLTHLSNVRTPHKCTQQSPPHLWFSSTLTQLPIACESFYIFKSVTRTGQKQTRPDTPPRKLTMALILVLSGIGHLSTPKTSSWGGAFPHIYKLTTQPLPQPMWDKSQHRESKLSSNHRKILASRFHLL
jgi:hypothetical protein